MYRGPMCTRRPCAHDAHVHKKRRHRYSYRDVTEITETCVIIVVLIIVLIIVEAREVLITCFDKVLPCLARCARESRASQDSGDTARTQRYCAHTDAIDCSTNAIDCSTNLNLNGRWHAYTTYQASAHT
jgi:hypothetical protein